MTKIGLVMQGGGALGAYQVGVVRRLLEKRFQPHIVSGVSIGATNAAVLCSPKNPDPAAGLEALWKDFVILGLPIPLPFTSEVAALMGNPGMYHPRTDYHDVWNWTSFYDHGPLLDTVERHVDFDRLRPGTDAPRLVLTATNIRTGDLDIFDSHKMPIRPEHVLASSSLPPGFPPTVLTDASGNEQAYWDGGLFDNTPLAHVINRLETGRDRVDFLVTVNLIPKRGGLPQNMLEVFDRMFEILFASKVFRDTKLADRIHALIDYREKVKHALPLLKASLPAEATEAASALDEIVKHEGFKILDRWFSVFDRIIEIETTEHEPINALSDFSESAIRRRIEAGYRDASARIP